MPRMCRASVGVRRISTPGGVGVDQQQAEAAVLGLARAGAHVGGDRGAGQAGAGAPRLLAVDHEVVAPVDGDGAQRRRVGPAVRLADARPRSAACRSSPRRGSQSRCASVPQLKMVSPGMSDADVAHGDVEAGPAELLGEQGQLDRAAAVTAVVDSANGSENQPSSAMPSEQLRGSRRSRPTPWHARAGRRRRRTRGPSAAAAPARRVRPKSTLGCLPEVMRVI